MEGKRNASGSGDPEEDPKPNPLPDAQKRNAAKAKCNKYKWISSFFGCLEKPVVVIGGLAGLFYIGRSIADTNRNLILTTQALEETKRSNETAVIALAETKRANDLTQSALDEQKKEANIAHRPWIQLHNLPVNVRFGSKPTKITFGVTNRGDSPAMDVSFSLTTSRGLCSKLPPWIGHPARKFQYQRLGVIGPDAEIGIHIVPTMKPEEAKRIMSGKEELCAWGFAMYRDVFDKCHRAWFCTMYVPADLAFGFCTGGGRYEEVGEDECKKNAEAHATAGLPKMDWW